MAVQSAVSVIIGAELGGTFKGAFGDAKTQLSSLGNAVKNLSRTSENITAFKKLGDDTLATGQRFTTAIENVKRLNAEIKNSANPTKQQARDFSRAKYEVARASAAYKQSKSALSEMASELKKAGVDTKNLTTEQTRLGSALETVKKRQAALAKNESDKANNLKNRVNYRSQIMDVVAIGTAMYGMINPAIAFESSMADVRKVVDFDTPQQFSEMGNAIKQMSKEIPLSLDGLAKIVASGGQLGVPREQLVAFAETAAKMSVAFGITADEAGDAMAKMSNVLQMPISEMGKVGDVINHLSNNMAASAAEIVEANLRAGAMGKSFGLAHNEISALTGTFISMGKSPEIAGTALNMMTSRMKLLPVATGAARDAFDMLGISMKDYTALIEKGDGKNAMIMMLEALQKTQGIKRSQIMKDMFGEQATRHINSLVEGLDSLKENFAKVANETEYAGSMQREFAARSATTQNNIQLLKNQMTILATNVGSTLLPAINSVVSILGKAASSLADFAEKHPTLIKYIGIAVAGMASMKLATFALGYGFTFLKGGFLSIVGIFTQARAAFSMIRLGLTALIPIIKSVGIAFLTNPITWIVAGIAGAAFVLIKYWTPIKEFFVGVAKAIAGAFDWLWGKIKSVWNSVKSIFTDLKEWMSDTWIGKAWNWAFGDDDEESKSMPQTKVGDTVSELIPATMGATSLPQSRISNSNMSSVSVSAPITINASPGMSEIEVARQVSRELDSRENEAQRRARGANYA
jgi:TP901 family phage tail tape measure protein